MDNDIYIQLFKIRACKHLFSKCLCFKDFIYLFSERGERKEKEWERNINA